MSQSVKMPALGESVTEGTITRWLKAEGDRVEVDEPLLEVSTDKVDTEIPSPVAGVVRKILVTEDETVAVGADLAIVGSGSTASPQESTTPQAPAQPASPQPGAPAQTVTSTQSPSVPEQGGATPLESASQPRPAARNGVAGADHPPVPSHPG